MGNNQCPCHSQNAVDGRGYVLFALATAAGTRLTHDAIQLHMFQPSCSHSRGEAHEALRARSLFQYANVMSVVAPVYFISLCM